MTYAIFWMLLHVGIGNTFVPTPTSPPDCRPEWNAAQFPALDRRFVDQPPVPEAGAGIGDNA
ncbi:hypothetical protein [Mesorhizobium sp. M0478]|uniref:hypothetical protein n=1 Tax=Mesorhizobium sp. M0478 TaxID=2956947 RepID=UPI003337ADE3